MWWVVGPDDRQFFIRCIDGCIAADLAKLIDRLRVIGVEIWLKVGIGVFQGLGCLSPRGECQIYFDMSGGRLAQ